MRKQPGDASSSRKPQRLDGSQSFGHPNYKVLKGIAYNEDVDMADVEFGYPTDGNIPYGNDLPADGGNQETPKVDPGVNLRVKATKGNSQPGGGW